MKNLMNWFVGEESGQGLVEYALIIALVSIVVVLGLGKLSTGLNKIFSDIAAKF